MKKLLTLLLVVIMTLSLAACGGGGDSSAGGSSRDASFQLSNENVTCIIEYDSSICDDPQYEMESITDYVYVYSEIGSATLQLIQGSASADEYVEDFKNDKLAGNYSDYYVKDLVVEPLDSCEVNGFEYKTYTYEYTDVYVSAGQEYENYGRFGYVQLTDDCAILMDDDLYYDNWTEFVESVIYIKEAK